MKPTISTSKGARRAAVGLGVLTFGLIALTGCHIDMYIQPKLKAGDEYSFFPNGQGSRPLVEHTVPNIPRSEDDPYSGDIRTENPFYTGYTGSVLVNGVPKGAKYVDTFPFQVNREVLKRGQDRFNIFCSPCHGRMGDGQGMIAQRGFSIRRPPASYHTDRLRKMPIGYFFTVMTEGHGAMYSYASRVEPRDRWAIAAYIRVLQYSEHAPVSDLARPDASELERAPLLPGAGAQGTEQAK